MRLHSNNPPTYGDIITKLQYMKSTPGEGKEFKDSGNNQYYVNAGGGLTTNPTEAEDSTKKLKIAAANAGNLSAGTAAWVNGSFIIGTGADNNNYYEQGKTTHIGTATISSNTTTDLGVNHNIRYITTNVNKINKLGTYTGNQSSISIANIPNYANRTFFITNPRISETATPYMMRDHGSRLEYHYEARIWSMNAVLSVSGSNISVTGAQTSMWVKEVDGPAGQPSSTTTVKMQYDIYYI